VDRKAVATLFEASEAELRRILVENLTCPIDWSDLGRGIAGIFLEKWAHVIESSLPNDLFDILQDSGEYLPEPGPDSIGWLDMDFETARALAFNTTQHRDEYHKGYLLQCDRLRELRAQTVSERHKHYVVAGATSMKVQQQSSANSKVGFLLPFITPSVQLQLLWLALSEIFFERRDLHFASTTVGDDDPDASAFNAAWEDVFGQHHRRLAVNTFDVVGYRGGNEASWLIFDISFDHSIFHCYPSLSGVDNADWNVSDDHLQGAKNAFDSGRSFDWLGHILYLGEE
jgi:hypothetical protein